MQSCFTSKFNSKQIKEKEKFVVKKFLKKKKKIEFLMIAIVSNFEVSKSTEQTTLINPTNKMDF